MERDTWRREFGWAASRALRVCPEPAKKYSLLSGATLGYTWHDRMDTNLLSLRSFRKDTFAKLEFYWYCVKTTAFSRFHDIVAHSRSRSDG